VEKGEVVKLREYGDNEIVRRVVRVEGDIVLVSREEEYQAAEREGREPVVAGVPLEKVSLVGEL